MENNRLKSQPVFKEIIYVKDSFNYGNLIVDRIRAETYIYRKKSKDEKVYKKRF